MRNDVRDVLEEVVSGISGGHLYLVYCLGIQMEKPRKNMKYLTESNRIVGGTRGRYFPNAGKNNFVKIF
jgi:hypothetical protein